MSIGTETRRLTSGALRGSAWIFSSNTATLALRVFFLAYLARLLSPDDFGLAAIGISFSAFAALFGDAGVSNALVQRKDLDGAQISTGFTYSLGLALLLLLLTLVTAPAMEAFFKMPGLASVLSVMGISFAFQALCVVPRALLKRSMQFSALAVIDFVAFNLGYGFTACVLAWLGLGVWSLVIATTTNNALAALFCFLRAPHELSPRFCRTAFSDLIRTSSGFSLAAIANLIALQADNLIVGRVLGAQALGFYSRAYQLMSIPANALGQVTDYVVFPMLSRIQGDQDRLRRAFLRGTTMTALGGIPASVLVSLYAPEIVHILFGAKWLPLTSILSILGAGTYFRLGYKIPSSVLQACGYVGTNAIIQCVYAACVVAGALLSVHYDLNILATAILGCVAIAHVLANYVAARFLGVTVLTFAKALAAAVLLSLILGCANFVMIITLRPYGSVFLTAGAGLLTSALAIFACLWPKPMRKSLLGQ